MSPCPVLPCGHKGVSKQTDKFRECEDTRVSELLSITADKGPLWFWPSGLSEDYVTFREKGFLSSGVVSQRLIIETLMYTSCSQVQCGLHLPDAQVLS